MAASDMLPFNSQAATLAKAFGADETINFRGRNGECLHGAADRQAAASTS
jgi:hypothetical protein